MKRFRYLILFLLFFLTGCSYKYDLKIDKDKKVIESVDVFESNSKFKLEGTTNKQYINMLFDIYKDDSNYSNYEIEKYFKRDVSGVLASASYDDFRSYMKENKVKKTLFGQIELFEENGHGFFKAYDYRGELFFSSEESDFKNDSVDFSLSIPFEVIDSNADSVDLENGVYSWHFDESSIDKDVSIEFDLSSIVVKNRIYMKILFGSLIGIFCVLILIFGIFIRYKRVNKI